MYPHRLDHTSQQPAPTESRVEQSTAELPAATPASARLPMPPRPSPTPAGAPAPSAQNPPTQAIDQPVEARG